MAVRIVSSECGEDFDEYVGHALGSWAPSSRPASRKLTNLWQGRRCKICLPGQEWHQGKVQSWTQSADSPNTPAKWSLELEIVQDAAEPDLKKRKVVDSSEGADSEGRTGTTVMTFPVNRLNIDGGGTLKADSEASSAELVSLEWMQPAEPVLDLNKGVLSYTCPYCRAIEPVVAAHEDPIERSQECPVCLETCECRVLQCGHGICHACWDSCRRSAILSLVDVDKLEAEEIANERAERHRLFRMIRVNGGESLKESAAAFAEIAEETSREKEGLTRFYRELMVEHPIVWMLPDLHDLYRKMPVIRLKILLQALEDRKVEFLSGFGLMTERMFHVLSAAAAAWIADSYSEADRLRLAIPWLHLASYHNMAKHDCPSDEVKPRWTVLGLLHLKYGQLTQALHSFDEFLHLDADDEEAREGREGVLLEMKEWTGASGKLTPKC